MGSPLRLTLVGGSSRDAARAWAMVRDDVERTEASLSRWREKSGLSQLNLAAGTGWVAVDGRLSAMLAASARAHRVSDGRFDPRVITRLEALGERAGIPLPEPGGGANSSKAGWLLVDPRRRMARLAAPIDSGGIGKGLALRWAIDAIRRAGLMRSGLQLEAGGDLVIHGEAPQGGAWQIGVEDPNGSRQPLAVIAATDGAVVTSSTAVRRWTTDDGRAVHHLIDPRTGEPGGDGLMAVTVAAADPAWAEVWSKSLFLSGRLRIGDEVRRRGLAAWWVEADGSLHLSPAARPMTAWCAADHAA
jgi:thiamine biosynthesis lipoprotein